ncbi:helix-turn-helix domain-containing protein [Hymenobacter sp. UV11]|uniref:helix-turn-helix domain-containing protein n=1 Tax=Hymenobacter sp. UV11 TaxID=1849735 RepID=UPI001414FDD8|nr:helix-turn-helix domain-containing protein [Hymenobacter sp. UV11]
MTDSERQALRQLQKQRRDKADYVKVTDILLLDKRRPLANIADDLGLNESTVYRYARAFVALGLARYLDHEQVGYLGLHLGLRASVSSSSVRR